MTSALSSALTAARFADLPLADVVGADLRVPLVAGDPVRYANLDYAASTPALRAVADRVAAFLPTYSSVHRGAGYASATSTLAYEAARAQVAAFVGARAGDVAVFTRNTTDSLNLLAGAVPGPVVHLDVEHHANLLPWRSRAGGSVRAVPAAPTLSATLAALDAELAREPAALLAVTGASNVTGELLPLADLAELAHRRGARLAVDGAQLVPHRRVNLARDGVDYLAFSGHKLYAPFGVGVLVGPPDWLDAAPAYLAGGGAVRDVTLDRTAWADSPARLEAGTPNVVGAVALAAACVAIGDLPVGAVIAHETALLDRLTTGLGGVDGVRLPRLWPDKKDGVDRADQVDQADRVGVATFAVDGLPAGLVAQYLSAEHGIGVRDGRFCAHPLLARLTGGAAALRASVGLGSRADDVDRLVEAVARLRTEGLRWTYAGPADGYRPTPDPRPLPDWLPGDWPAARANSATTSAARCVGSRA